MLNATVDHADKTGGRSARRPSRTWLGSPHRTSPPTTAPAAPDCQRHRPAPPQLRCRQPRGQRRLGKERRARAADDQILTNPRATAAPVNGTKKGGRHRAPDLSAQGPGSDYEVSSSASRTGGADRLKGLDVSNLGALIAITWPAEAPASAFNPGLIHLSKKKSMYAPPRTDRPSRGETPARWSRH